MGKNSAWVVRPHRVFLPVGKIRVKIIEESSWGVFRHTFEQVGFEFHEGDIEPVHSSLSRGLTREVAEAICDAHNEGMKK